MGGGTQQKKRGKRGEGKVSSGGEKREKELALPREISLKQKKGS